MSFPLGSLFEVKFIYEYSDGSKALNVLHYVNTTASTLASSVDETLDVANAAAAVGGLGEAIIDALAENVEMVGITAQCIRDTLGQRYALADVDGLGNGTFVGACTAHNVSAVITKRTTFSGRWAVGSFHMPGVPFVAYADGLITNVTYLGELADIATELLAPLTGPIGGGTYEPCLVHKPGEHGGHTLLFDTEVQTQLRTMRSRTVGRGI